ncbi:BLUF domain-containing protein [Stenotrophomonas sp.]|jgi:hypothetical protein|uniref:BLUF domain-containing protein n=1 Tax=Stenotrophomonas TaxID=40323 RepID=UPI0013115C67|nr:BLUF domain-containing protein [Stenotrophomonas sp.]
MPLCAIAYVSDAVDGIQASDIDQILAAAGSFNKVAGVTGVLMFDGHHFLQYFEGPDDGVNSVYHRVLNSRVHRNLRQLLHARIPARNFPRWTMASAAIEPEVLASIADGAWAGFAVEPPAADGRTVGFTRLLELWTGVHGELEPAALTLGS